MKKVVINPVGQSALVHTGSNLLSALLAKNLKVLMSCGGRGICSTCHVYISSGMEQLSPIGPVERRTLGLVADAGPNSRLACQAIVFGDGVEVCVPEGMYIEKADDLLSLLGTPAPQNILHPITGVILIPKGKIITRTMFEQSRSLDQEVKRLRESAGGISAGFDIPQRPIFTASGVSLGKNLSGTTQFINRSTLETKVNTGSLSTATEFTQKSTTHDPIDKSHPTSQRLPRQPDQVSQPTTNHPPIPKRESASSVVGPPSSRLTSSGHQQVEQPPIHSLSGPPPTVAVDLSKEQHKVTSSHSSTPAGIVPIYPGAQIGKYLLLELIGKGGSGVVYRALHTTLKTLVAVKFLRNDLGSGVLEAVERLAQEARLLAQLVHPNVVRVLDFEDHPTQPYVVMEYVDGLSAADLIKQSGRISPGRAVQIALDVAAGLQAAHKIGIIHRDVKPGNIIVSREGSSKLVDLGLATIHRPDKSKTAADQLVGTIEGTVGYMSPEVLTGNLGDHRSDIYSLGATLFHLIAGQLPFPGRSAAEVITKHMLQPPPALHQLVPETPPELSKIIQTMMAKQPSERYQNYADVRAALMQIRDCIK
ncbi:MAG: protein kinase [Thermogemmata sp.]|nr:protein kinase [Thermogemmata sp.]